MNFEENKKMLSKSPQLQFENRPGIFQKSNECITKKLDYMDNEQLQMYYYILSKLDSTKKITELTKSDLMFSFDVNELKKAFNAKKRLNYHRIKNKVLQLSKKGYLYEDKEDLEEYFRINIFSFVYYKNGKLQGKLNDDILPFWFGFSKENRFTTLKISDTSKLKKTWGQKLYEILEMDKWKQKIIFEIDFLKKQMNVSESQQETKYFMSQVIKKGVKDIEDNLGWKIEIKKSIKDKGLITHLEFIVDKNPKKEDS